MNLLRRQFLQLAAGAVAAPGVARRTFADAYPGRPVRLLSGFAPAGGNDIIARLIGQWLTERLGQTFIIENRPGAGTNIATEIVINSPPDGYTLFVTNPSNAINATLYEKLNFNFMRDMLPVAGIAQAPAVLAINSSVPARTVTEFIVHAKANPGKINMGSAGVGSTAHLAGELFKSMAGVDLIHVPYRGNASALTDLMGGQIEVLFPSLGSSIEYVKTGKVVALAVTGDTRSDALPDVPTVAETLPGYQAASFYGIGAPRNTPAEIVEVLNKVVNAGLADPKLKARLADLGYVPLPGTPAAFGKLIADETEKWGKVIRFAGIKPQ
ncbi:MAG TPA: tripartite tricarboxylate transporter substrate binding protein [Xanthobacteraceae bacterium]|nr:tripartite tricarboxylate transporter substrate binding protein [Xanthobacteraceae bacterium]